ncbi:MAG: potassium channel protein [Polyangiaceae bacterium]
MAWSPGGSTSSAPRILPPIIVLAGVIVGGGGVMYVLGDGRWSFSETLYFAIICASTVGFGEPEGFVDVPYARVVSSAIILGSLCVVAYFQSTLTTFLVQDVLGERLRNRRMQKKIASLENHVIIAGAGSVGRHAIEELVATATPFVVIDHSRHVLEKASSDLANDKMLFMTGDATLDATLVAAGVERAMGVIAALTEDKDNLYVTLTARELNPHVRIVTKVVHGDAVRKMMRAGASATVAPARIGGLRLASEILRPTAVAFLDKMLYAREHRLRIDELDVTETSWFVGKQLRDLPIRQATGVLVLAIYEGEAVRVSPGPETVIDSGMTLVVIGEVDNVERLRQLANRTEPPPEFV